MCSKEIEGPCVSLGGGAATHSHWSTFSQHGRAMAKLLKEAQRVKRILSANTEATAQVKGLSFSTEIRLGKSSPYIRPVLATPLD